MPFDDSKASVFFGADPTSGRRLLVHTGAIAAKTTRSTQGVQVMTLKGPSPEGRGAVCRGYGDQTQPLPHQEPARRRRHAAAGGYRGAAHAE